MSLLTQIETLLFSFIFGIMFSLILDITKKYIYHNNIVIKIISSFCISLILSLIYFIINIKINNGIIHIYFIGAVLIGYFFDYKFFTLHKRIKKNVNKLKLIKK